MYWKQNFTKSVKMCLIYKSMFLSDNADDELFRFEQRQNKVTWTLDGS